MRRPLLVAVLGILLVAVGCSSSSNSSGGSSGAQTRQVEVDGHAPQFNAAFLAYFPNQVTARPGDTVEFKEIWTGEPHTVTMGTLVEAGLKAAKGADPNGPPPPAYASLPSLLPQGPGDINQNAASPCFLATGSPPSAPNQPCAQAPQPAFDGKQTYFNSGFLAPDAVFKVKLADNLATGTYTYYCNLHGPDMSGTIQVKAKGSSIPSQADVTTTGTAQRSDLVNKVLPSYQQAKAGQAPIPGNLAGYASQDAQTVLVDEFIPAIITTKVGQKVTWTVFGPHTITFGAPSDAQSAFVFPPGGGAHFNQAAVSPQNSPSPPSPPQSAGPPSTGPPKPTVADGGSYNGTGFKSSGTYASFPPDLLGYSLTFTKAGSFPYVCTIHPGMTGVVQVS